MMDRCELAVQYHQKGFNCAQSVLAAFTDMTHLSEQEALAVSGGFGGGIGGSHQEVCGALSGAVMVLGLVYPHNQANDPEGKRRTYAVSQDVMKRFQTRFDHTRCGDLLAAKIEVNGEKTPAAVRLGIKAHCAVLIVTAVELVEEMLREQGVSC